MVRGEGSKENSSMVTPHAEQPTRREFVNEPWPVVGSLALAGLALGGSATGHQDDLVTFNVVKHGAKGDGKSKDTTAIQATIDACHEIAGDAPTDSIDLI